MATAAPSNPYPRTRGSLRMPLRSLNAPQINAVSNNRNGSPLARNAAVNQALSSLPSGHENRHASGEEDSSDDESNAAPVLSAAAEELLGGRSSQGPRQAPIAQRQSYARNYAGYAGGSPMGRESVLARDSQAMASNGSPEQQQMTSATRSRSPRIVRVGSVTRNGSPGSAFLRRVKSTGSANGSPMQKEAKNFKTPAPASRPRSYLEKEEGSPIALGAQSGRDLRGDYHGSSGKSTADKNSAAAASADSKDDLHQGTVTKEYGVHSSLRIKRLGQGTFLRGPARRGMLRRQSEEEQSPLQKNSGGFENLYGSADKQGDNESPLEEHGRSKVHVAGDEIPVPIEGEAGYHHSARKSPERGEAVFPESLSSNHHRFQFNHQPRIATAISAQNEKENELPVLQHHQQKHQIPLMADVLGEFKPVIHSAVKLPDQISPRRAPLAAKSTNTPLRPAPPPPKMNVVDTATAAAGAMASQKRKKQAIASMTVNGRRFTRLDCIGRGGSGKVFRVMAENYKLYALKRVSLEGMDELAIRGFKGEINLLQKLKDVERVVRLIDYEVNDERQTLTVLMEMGELDLKKLLDPRLDEQTGVFDVTFTRYIWREMLECVQAVHECDVVHSDLKPANFVMVQGKLKLIDFGISNAIADDTVNVHREQQIGTPNYMAPEALVDTNAHERGMAGVAKLMKLGKPSDVWSLGCILYQIVYGKTPFSHIQATHSKVMAIVSERHQISFPERGLGGTHVPLGLLRTMKRCLMRDQKMRPSIAELLRERDPFLHPDAEGLIPLNEELLGMIQRKLVSVIKQRGSVPDEGEIAMWQSNMFQNVRNAIKEGKVQV